MTTCLPSRSDAHRQRQPHRENMYSYSSSTAFFYGLAKNPPYKKEKHRQHQLSLTWDCSCSYQQSVAVADNDGTVGKPTEPTEPTEPTKIATNGTNGTRETHDSTPPHRHRHTRTIMSRQLVRHVGWRHWGERFRPCFNRCRQGRRSSGTCC